MNKNNIIDIVSTITNLIALTVLGSILKTFRLSDNLPFRQNADIKNRTLEGKHAQGIVSDTVKSINFRN